MPFPPLNSSKTNLTRRQFIGLLGMAALAYPLRVAGGDWEAENPLAKTIRERLENLLAGRAMALDFRRINVQLDEDFRIQIQAFDIFPGASCFKAFLALYYYLNTPREAWQDTVDTPLYSTAVYSNNTQTGAVILDVGTRVKGGWNALEKFNNFLHLTLGMEGGLYTWDWPGTPTVGLYDTRYAERQMTIRGIAYPVINFFTANDLARGYDILTRGDTFAVSPTIREAIQATRTLLSIPASDYLSPLERAYPLGYMGKDGILPAGDIAVGRVVNDAGVITVNGNRYIIAFLSAGESESVALDILKEVINQINAYEAGG